MQDFSFLHFAFLYIICGLVPEYLEKMSNSRKGNKSFFKYVSVRTSLQNFPSFFQTHYAPPCKVLIKNSLLSFSSLKKQIWSIQFT